MNLSADLLKPIPGDNPSGQSLRYDPLYEKVKEAAREEDELSQGDWAREVKKADPALVLKLTSGALAARSKDLQLVAWLTEALLRKEGFPGLNQGLDLFSGMIRDFWDTLYPEIEDGDAGLRSAPLNRVGSYFDGLVKKTPLTRGGFDWFKYLESRSVGYEAACSGSESKMAARQAAIAENKLTPEAFDEDVERTSREFYAGLTENIASCLASLQALDELCEEKFGRDDSPSFIKLRTSLEDVQSLAESFLKAKPAPEAPAAPATEDTQSTEQAEPGMAPAARRPAAAAEEPADYDDALRKIVLICRYLRHAEPLSPAAFLILRGLRWGELRAAGAASASGLLEPPPTATRQQIKRLAVEGNWSEVIDAAEAAMATPCGRGWLDLQRYVVTACRQLGSDYDAIARAIRSGVGVLIADLPWLPKSAFLDDTPVANEETLTWVREIQQADHASGEGFQSVSLISEPVSGNGDGKLPDAQIDAQPDAEIDAQILAMQAARSGRTEEAFEILMREIAQEPSGRARFERKTQLANLCISVGHHAIAYPILRELADEIERRKLDEWESPAMLAKPLALLFSCLAKMDSKGDERGKIYERLCRLDPLQALACLK